MPWQPHPIYMIKAEFLRVLGHPKRVRILELLQDGERTVGDLQAELELDSSGTSQHLAALRRVGVVESRRAGSSVYYRVRDERMFALMAIAREIVTANAEYAQALIEDVPDSGASGQRSQPTE